MHVYALLYHPFCLALHVLFWVYRVLMWFVKLLSFVYTIRVPVLEERKKVVIVGGGFAGTLAALHLDAYFNVTLIDSKDYFEFTPSVLRTIVEPMHIKKIQIMHNHYLKQSCVLTKEVTGLARDHVVCHDKTIPFDYLILNMGSSYTQPFKEGNVISSGRANTLRESYYALRKVNKILVIGGGLVGVELAAEIAVHFKNKEVILVNSQPTLIPRFPKKAIAYTEKFLRSRGVRIYSNERIVGHRGQLFVTDQGSEIMAEVAFLCTGIKANSSLLQTSFPESIDENGYVKTNEHFQLMTGDKVHQNIFVAGDVVSIREEKLAQAAEVHGQYVADNIFRLDKNRTLKKYKTPYAWPILISLGKYHGVFVYGPYSFTGPIPALLKEFVEWKSLVRYW